MTPTIDGVLILVGLVINAVVVFNMIRLQLKLQRTLLETAREINAIHIETNDMRDKLEKNAYAEGKLEGIAEEIKRHLKLPIDDPDVN